MDRYLIRLANVDRKSPGDISQVAEEVRRAIGAKEAAGHFRIGSAAIEFNMFASNQKELERRQESLGKNGYHIIGKRRLDVPSPPLSKAEAIKEGVQLFNEERFWESHEILEQAWQASKGPEKNSMQGLILTAAAFVHQQKNEPDICLSILKRARQKIENGAPLAIPNLDKLKTKIDSVLGSGEIRLFKLN